MEYTQKNAVETTQVNSTNTSNLILLIKIANLIQNGTDLEYIECMADIASKIQDRRRSRLPKPLQAEDQVTLQSNGYPLLYVIPSLSQCTLSDWNGPRKVQPPL